MKFKEVISHLRNSPNDGWFFIQGNIRLAIYNRTRYRWLLRKHIVEQFEWRRDAAAPACYENGECLCCGCETPSLFFAAKGCAVQKQIDCQVDGLTKCYPKMMTRKQWKRFLQSKNQ